MAGLRPGGGRTVVDEAKDLGLGLARLPDHHLGPAIPGQVHHLQGAVHIGNGQVEAYGVDGRPRPR